MAHSWQPHFTVAAICEKNHQFLLVKERDKFTKKTVFNQPAGHIEPGESLVEAVVRETREETCRHFIPQSIIGHYRLELAKKTYFRFTFFGEISDIDTTLCLDTDIIDTCWMSLEEIQSCQQLRSPLVLRSILDYLSNNHYPLDICKEC